MFLKYLFLLSDQKKKNGKPDYCRKNVISELKTLYSTVKCPEFCILGNFRTFEGKKAGSLISFGKLIQIVAFTFGTR